MSFQSYIDNIQAKTGLGPDEFIAEAKKKGYLDLSVSATEITNWLKEDYDLGYGHAGAIYKLIRDASAPKQSADDKVDKHFIGAKEHWRASYDKIVAKSEKFGADGVTVIPAA